MYNYDTLSEAINGLRERGYSVDFNLEKHCLICNGQHYTLADFKITEFYRFEGPTDPSDEAIV